MRLSKQLKTASYKTSIWYFRVDIGHVGVCVILQKEESKGRYTVESKKENGRNP